MKKYDKSYDGELKNVELDKEQVDKQTLEWINLALSNLGIPSQKYKEKIKECTKEIKAMENNKIMSNLNKKGEEFFFSQKCKYYITLNVKVCQVFFIKPTIGSNKKYVKISGTIAVISGNIKLINNSFILKHSDISYAPFLSFLFCD